MADPAEILPNDLWLKIQEENFSVKDVLASRQVNRLWRDKNKGWSQNSNIPSAICKRDLKAEHVDVDTYEFLCRRGGYARCRPDTGAVQDLCKQFTVLRCMNCNKNIVGVSREGKEPEYSESANRYIEWLPGTFEGDYYQGVWHTRDIWVCEREECRRAAQERENASEDERARDITP